MPQLPAESRTVTADTASGRYPPLYYAVVGVPTLVVTSSKAVIFMRLVSALLNAVFLGLAVMVAGIWSRNRLLTLGILLAVTPMTFYLGAMVNPNGLEISAALCLWASGLVLALEHIDDPPKGLVAVTALAAAVLTLARGISPLWSVIVIMALTALCDPRKLVSLTRRRTDVQVGLALVVACSVFAVGWILREHTLDLVYAGPQLRPGASMGYVLARISTQQVRRKVQANS